MPVGQYNLQQDLAESEKMVQTMINYLRQNNLYYPLGGSLPQMTLGGFLIRTRRLRLLQDRLSTRDVVALHDIEDKHMKILDEWLYHYVRKLNDEVQSRQRAINYFLVECAEDLTACQQIYRPEAFRRTAIEHVLEMMKKLQATNLTRVTRNVQYMDRGLQAIVEEATFVWDDNLSPIYPADIYWWLYRKPIEKVKQGKEPTANV